MHDHRINVAMYCPYFMPAYGGAELASMSLAEELHNLCDVELYTFNWTQDLDAERKYCLNFSCNFPKKEIVNGVVIHRYPVANLPVVRNFSLELVKDLTYCGAEIIHLQGITRLFSRLLLQAAENKKIKILSTHGLQEAKEIMKQSKKGSLVKAIFMKSLRELDHIIALTRADADFLMSSGVDGRKVTLIPNGINADRFAKRRKFVERNTKPKILCVARFDKNKNYESLIYALDRLKYQIEFEAYFIGALTDRQYFESIIKLIKTKGLERSIIIGSSLDDPAVIDCYLSCDLFVLPSNAETFSLVVLEAMYAGLPIVSTPVGFVPEVVKNGINGFIVPKNDPLALSEKILALLKNERIRRMMGDLNKQVAKDYTWNKIALSTYNLYRQLIEETPRKGVTCGA